MFLCPLESVLEEIDNSLEVIYGHATTYKISKCDETILYVYFVKDEKIVCTGEVKVYLKDNSVQVETLNYDSDNRESFNLKFTELTPVHFQELSKFIRDKFKNKLLV